jgi:ABC-type lipoprotein release transport system permease subunit
VATRLADDPLARGTLLVLLVAAVVAPLLAVVGLALAAAADLRDEGGALLDLEAQGVPPRTLRRGLQVGSVMVAVTGLLGGVAVGALLTRSVVDVLLVTAAADVPEPPLVARVDWLAVAPAAACYLLVGLAAVAAVTRSAFRAPVAGRAVATDL